MGWFKVELTNGDTEIIEADYGVLHANGSLTFHKGNPAMEVLAKGDQVFTEGHADAPAQAVN